MNKTLETEEGAIKAWEEFSAGPRGKLAQLVVSDELSWNLFDAACQSVAVELADADPEYIAATAPMLSNLEDSTRISTLVLQRMKGDPGSSYPLRPMNAWTANESFCHHDGNFAVAENIDTHGALSMTFGERQVVIATSDVITRYMVGAAASFRMMNRWQQQGDPIIVAVGDRTFIEEGLTSADVTFLTDSKRECQNTVNNLHRMHADLRVNRLQVYFLVQDISVSADLGVTIRLMLDDDELPITSSVGMSLNQQNFIYSATQLLMGQMTIAQLENLGINEINARHIAPQISPSMLFELTQSNAGGRYGISRYFPLGREYVR